jgi:uncharacterized protein
LSGRREVRARLSIFFLILAGNVPGQSYVPEYGGGDMKVKPVVSIRAYPFSVKDVRLLDGPFRKAMEADVR